MLASWTFTMVHPIPACGCFDFAEASAVRAGGEAALGSRGI